MDREGLERIKQEFIEKLYKRKRITSESALAISTQNKNFLDEFAKRAHIKRQYVGPILTVYYQLIRDLLCEGYPVRIPGVGNFLFQKKKGIAKRCLYNNVYNGLLFPGLYEAPMFRFNPKFFDIYMKRLKERDGYHGDPMILEDVTNRRFSSLKIIILKSRKVKEKELELGVRDPHLKILTETEILEKFDMYFPDGVEFDESELFPYYKTVDVSVHNEDAKSPKDLVGFPRLHMSQFEANKKKIDRGVKWLNRD